MEKNKVVIIGSGIAGMTCAIYLKRGGLEPVIIENSAPGGVLNIIPNIENYPGYKSISGPDLAMNIYNQVQELNIKYIFKNIKEIDLENKKIDNEIEYDYLVIATGRRNRMLDLDNEKKLLEKGISTCALCDGNFYKDKDVVVIGGGSSALTEALYLSNICKKVTIIHRGPSFTGEECLINKVNNCDNIEIIFSVKVINYNTDEDKLVSVTLSNNKEVLCDGVFLSIGSIPNSELFNVKKEKEYIIVDNNYQTSVEDVYAIGDVIKKDIYQLTTAASDATICASDIISKNK